MNILLIGECFSSNLGDPLICENVKHIILNKYPSASIKYLDLSGRIDWSKQYDIQPSNYSVFEKLFFKITDLFSPFFKCSELFIKYKASELRYLQTILMLKDIMKKDSIDFAVFAGGSLFMDYFIPLIYIVVKILSLKHINIIFHACGTSKMDAHDRSLLKKILNNKYVKSISMRDSFDSVQKLVKNKSKIIETFDTALNTPTLYKISSSKIATYGIGVYGDNDDFYDYQINLIKKFMDSECDWRIFTNGSAADYNAAKRILFDSGVDQKDIHKYLLKRPENPEELVRDITSFERIISFRMHSLIVATSFGVPVIGIKWDKKIEEFLNKLNQNDACYSKDQVFNFDENIFLLQSETKKVTQKQAIISQKHLIDAIQSEGMSL